MKTIYPRITLMTLMGLLLLCGCKPQPTKEQVEIGNLKAEVEALKKEVAAQNELLGTERTNLAMVVDYLRKGADVESAKYWTERLRAVTGAEPAKIYYDTNGLPKMTRD